MTDRTLAIAPSILSADFTRLGEEIRIVEAGGADRIHFDVMDGHFVPNISMGPVVVKSARKITTLPFDVHLMISDPDRYLEPFAQAGSNVLIPHIEVCQNPHNTIKSIRDLGCDAGFAISPDTPVSALREVAPHISVVLVMSVYPGYSGQAFMEKSHQRVREVRALLDGCNPGASVSVDGGIDESTIGRVVAAGADNLVASSAIYSADVPPDQAVRKLRRAAQAALDAR